MKFLVGIDKYTYSFDPGSQQVTISGLAGELQLEQFLIITNVTNNAIIYNFADASAGGSLGAINGSIQTLTLDYDTTNGMSSGDNLQIFMQDRSAPDYAIINDPFDYIDITYVSDGSNGAGEINTIIYKDGGSGGPTVATLTLNYNSNDELTSITRT